MLARKPLAQCTQNFSLGSSSTRSMSSSRGMWSEFGICACARSSPRRTSRTRASASLASSANDAAR